MNKVALITGGSKGIGAKIAQKLAIYGYDIIINYNTSEKEAYLLKEQLNQNYNVNVYCIKCDITNEDEILKMKEVIFDKYSKIDLLINNAAYSSDNYIKDKTKEEFMRVMEVNVCGPFLMTKHFCDYLDGGTIVNISSTDAVDTYSPISMDYCASKAALNSLTKTLAQEFNNIKVFGVMPPWTNTEEVRKMNKDYLNNELKRIGQKKLFEPEEIAQNIVDLINDNSVESGDIFYECKRNSKKC